MRERLDIAEEFVKSGSLVALLRELGFVLRDKTESTLGVDLYRFDLGGETIDLFIDCWGGCDIEGPHDVVSRVRGKLAHRSA